MFKSSLEAVIVNKIKNKLIALRINILPTTCKYQPIAFASLYGVFIELTKFVLNRFSQNDDVSFQL